MGGDDPLGTDHGVMVRKDAHDRLLMTHEAASEHGDDARQLLQHVKALGLHVIAACCVHSFRSLIRQLVTLFDQAHSEAQAKRRFKQLSKDIQAMKDPHLDKILHFFDDHWDQALRYLWKAPLRSWEKTASMASMCALPTTSVTQNTSAW